MRFKFKIDPYQKLFKTDDFYTNGHWLIRRSYLPANKALDRSFARLANIPNGSYAEGYTKERTSETAPDCQRIIPSLKDYLPASISRAHVGTDTRGLPIIAHVELKTDEPHATAWINPAYVPILALGRVFIRSALLPVAVVDADDNIAALIMPIRQ